jgi:FeS assembly SUF system regulator
MLRISKLSDYAIIVLGQMAKQPGRTFAAHELSEETGVANPTVSKILKALVRFGVLHSTRGARGGYILAHPPERTPISSIITALEGPIALTECGVDHNHCDQSRSCNVRANWSVLNRAIQTALEAVTLADMVHPMTRAPEEFHIPLASLSFASRRPQE